MRAPNRILSGILLGFSSSVGLTAPAAADIALIPASADATMYADAGDFANGDGDHFFAGTTDNGIPRRGIVRFDAAGAIPAGSLITGATLTLHMSRTNTGPQTVSLHRALASWTEGATHAPGEEGGGWPAESPDVTWTHRALPDLEWTTPGGDFDPDPSATIFVGGIGFSEWSDPLLTADVAAWLANPDANFGWVLLGDEDFNATAKRFDSRTHPQADRRPVLRVEYTVIPSPIGSAVFFAAAAAALTRRPTRGGRSFV